MVYVTCVKYFCGNVSIQHIYDANCSIIRRDVNEKNQEGNSGSMSRGDEQLSYNQYKRTERSSYSETKRITKVKDDTDPKYKDSDKADDNDNGNDKTTHLKQRWCKDKACMNERLFRQELVRSQKKHWSQRVRPISQLTFRKFILFISTVKVIMACPEIIASICRCEDSYNGIILKCSRSDGRQAIHMLKANQINLGLIQQLEMQNSGLQYIPAEFFSGLFIKRLDLSHNNIADIDENGFLGMNNVLQELELHHNNLTQLPAKALTPLTALIRLDLSNNSIGDIGPEHALPPLSKLYDVNLANNRICQVHKNAFDDVKYNIQTINLGRNCLREVPAPAIRGFKQLMALHLHNNNITTLGALSFMNLPLMNLLNLASNQISNIHMQTFLNVPNLRYLYLTGNRITDIRPQQFSSFEQLEMLDLSGNYLIELQEDSFSNLQNLRQLYIGENRIANIQPHSFANSSVVILNMNSNRLVEIRGGMFDGLAKLQQLALKDNQIRSIDQSSFYYNPSLAMIDLSHNELLDIPPSTFLAQINLFLIDLSNNKLLRTPYGAFSRRVKTVLLQENPLVCSERVHMLQQGVGIYVSSSIDAVCGLSKDSDQSSTVTYTSTSITIPISPTPTYLIPDQGQTENLVATKVIRPMSTINNELSKQHGNNNAQGDTDNKILIRPISVSEQRNPSPQPILPLQIPITGELPNIETHSNAISKSEARDYGQGLYNDNKVSKDAEMRNKSKDSNQYPFYTNNMIHPIPVPFLKRPSKLSQAHVATSWNPVTDLTTSRRISSKQTLPPSIVIADHLSRSDPVTKVSETEANHIEKAPIADAKETLENGEQILIDLNNTERLEHMAAPSVIILICLSTVAIVMAAVFIGLCIAKHRRMQTFRDSMKSSNAAATRANAYVSAQLDMIYETAQRNRNMPMQNRLENGQQWIYAPTSYGSTDYYK